jgi:hypothetical protein
LGDRLLVRYGAEYFLVSLGPSTASIRPLGELVYRLSNDWTASFTVASRPWAHAHGNSDALQSTLEELDAFPTLMMRDGRPVLETGWHQELAAHGQLGRNVRLTFSLFNDQASHTALMGRGDLADSDAFQDFYSNAFTYDGGASGGLGARVAWQQRLSEDSEFLLLFASGPALALEESAGGDSLRDSLRAVNRQSFAARFSTRLPRARTKLSASYKWIGGPVVSRQDAFGEVTYQVDPFLNLSLRQPIPGSLFSARVEALADFRNLLAQGYVPVNTGDGQVLLIPAFRSFRGGFSFQF